MLWGSPHGLLAAGPLSKGQHLLSVNTNDKDGLDVEGLGRNQKKNRLISRDKQTASSVIPS